MSKQVLSIEQMQHLKELGVDTSKASMYLVRLVRLPNVKNKEKEVLIDWFLDLQKESMHVGYDEYECLPTFTLQDILNLLPNKVDDELILFIDKGKHKWRIAYTDISSEEIFEDFSDKNFIDAAYEMLCWVVENGYLKDE